MSRSYFWFWMACVILVIGFFGGCNAKSGGQAAEGGKPVVNLAIWSNYVTSELLSEFEAKTGIHVQVSNYSSNEELLAKLQAGAGDYDVAVPSDYMVFVMSKLGLLHALDKGRIPNAQGLDAGYLKKGFDPENSYSLPYARTITGIAVNRKLYKKPVRSWKDFFANPALKGKLSLLDDAREVIGAALKMQGYSLNSKRPEELAKAKAILMAARSRVKA